MLESPGIEMRDAAPSVGRLSANSALKMSAVAPSQASVIAMPVTIWSSPSRTQRRTITSETAAPAAIPAPNPAHWSWP